ncbi:MAG: PH domain-containing protein [Actinomycetota bacterium]|nr:PH domain-containing protein [Actinomycetota bacterium]
MTVTAYPRRTRQVCVAMAILIVAGFAVIGALLKESTAGTAFATSDQFAMVGLGIVIAVGVLSLTRPRVYADAERIRIRNIVVSHDLRWQVVDAVRFPDGASWPFLELYDDETVAILAIQAVDKQRAVDAFYGLRALHEASRRPGQPAAGPDRGMPTGP